ncbi:MAG TPA: polyphenol oxidase family protein [Solirubrobacteraceae bacterium]
MDVPAPFTWTGSEIALGLPGGQVRFTTRRSPALEAVSGIAPRRQAQSRQVHEADVRRIASDDDLLAAAGDFDGQATNLWEVACVVRVADCVPVALVAPGAVAALHAGWRGLRAGILEAGIAAVGALGGATGELRAAIGPGAGVCCYEAGDEVHAAFAHLGPGVRRGANADLKAVAAAILRAGGVREIHDVGICTICADAATLWSFRREGDAAGRQLGVTWRS